MHRFDFLPKDQILSKAVVHIFTDDRTRRRVLCPSKAGKRPSPIIVYSKKKTKSKKKNRNSGLLPPEGRTAKIARHTWLLYCVLADGKTVDKSSAVVILT